MHVRACHERHGRTALTMGNLSHITHFGLRGIDRIPFGSHACQFYGNRDELVGALVPYFVAGLRGNERCIWVAAPPLPAREAYRALRGSGVDNAIEQGALLVLDFDQWYANSAGLKGNDVIKLWLKEEERALGDGYNGLRIAGNMSFLKPADWPTFIEYEQAVSSHFKSRRIVALCSYMLAQRTDQQMNEVVHAHHWALKASDVDGKWVAQFPSQFTGIVSV